MMNEMNKLIWPAPDGFGMVEDETWNARSTSPSTPRTLDGATFITEEPDAGA